MKLDGLGQEIGQNRPGPRFVYLGELQGFLQEDVAALGGEELGSMQGEPRLEEAGRLVRMVLNEMPLHGHAGIHDQELRGGRHDSCSHRILFRSSRRISALSVCGRPAVARRFSAAFARMAAK